jgi:CBS domain-containing protein
MLRLRDIMTTNALTVTPETTVREAMELLARHHVSGAPVISGGDLVGVVSGTDLMSFAAALSGVPTENDTNEEWGEWAEPSMADDVEQGNEPASAFFSDMWDDAGAEVTGRIASASNPEWNVLEEHDVSELMTRTPLTTLGPDASAEAAAELMRTKGIHRVLVTEGEKLVGIVSALDIATAAADHRFTNRRYVFNRDENFDRRE